MKRHVKTLDSISGRFFLVGLLAAKLKNIPIFMFASVFNIVSLTAYLIGYLIWYTTAFFYHEQRSKRESWYGFAQFKEQFQAAAIFGLLATVFCLITPALIIPAAWIYTVSNTFWSIGEYHKKASPSPEDTLYSSVRQALYLRYALSVSASSGVTALAATIIFFYPAAAFVVLVASTTISVSLIAAIAYYWGKCFFGVFPPDNAIFPHTYGIIAQELGVVSVAQNSNENIIAETPHAAPLFKSIVARNDDGVDDLLGWSHGPNLHDTFARQ